MIISSTQEGWAQLWGAVEDEMQDSCEKGLTIIFSVHEVETVCSVKMMQVCEGQHRCGAGLRMQLCVSCDAPNDAGIGSHGASS
jgi:hypothetical protein